MANASGQMTFYFATLRELEDQLRAALGLGRLVEVALGADFGLTEHEKKCPPACVYPEQGAPVCPEQYRASSEDLMKAAAKAFAVPPMAGKTSIPLPEMSEEVKAEIAAPPAEIPPAAAQVAPAPSTAGPAVPPPPEQNAPTLTLETLAAAPYPELLAFCACNPEVGVNPEKCGPTFFRPLVESKIKTYLETK